MLGCVGLALQALASIGPVITRLQILHLVRTCDAQACKFLLEQSITKSADILIPSKPWMSCMQDIPLRVSSRAKAAPKRHPEEGY